MFVNLCQVSEDRDAIFRFRSSSHAASFDHLSNNFSDVGFFPAGA